MPEGRKINGGDLFIVDNSDSDWKVCNYLSEWADIAKSFDIATGYFEIGALLALDGQWQKLEKLRILMGEEVSRRTRKALLAGIESVKGVLDQSIEREKDSNEFLNGVPAIFETLRNKQIECKVYNKDWFMVKRPALRAGSVDVYQNAITRLLDYYGASKQINELTPMLANRFIAEQGRIDGRPGELSNWSRARILRNCKTLFNDALSWGMIVQNPFGSIKRPKLPKQRWHYVTPKEFRSLLDARNGKHTVSLRYRALYSLAYCCGLRLGEIVNLMWEDIDFNEAEVRIEDRPATNTRPPFVVKDKEARKIGIPDEALSLLMDLKAYNDLTDQTPYVALTEGQYQTAVKKWQKYQEEKREWKSRDMQNNTLNTFKRHAVWAGIKPTGSLTLHGLRKSCITNWANEINNPEVVRRLAGHSDIKTTMQYYSAVTKEQRDKATKAINELLKAEKNSGERYV